MRLFGRNRSKLSDLELVAEYKSTGSTEVLADLFLRYNHLVLGVCYKYLKDTEASKDMSMHVFEKLVQKLNQFEITNFSSWLHTLVRNECLMELRKRQLAVSSTGFSDNDENDGQVLMEYSLQLHPLDNESSDLEGDLSKLEKCIKELGEDQKVCVELFFLQEKCYKEISEASGFDLKKVKSYIQNGKRNLKICMERNS
jgi:RNA polymerase sigma-70 factor (ECF subfamily)